MVARQHIAAERRGLRASITAREFYHPADLQRQIRRSLAAPRPDLVVIDVGAVFVAQGPGAVDLSAFPERVRTAYDRVRHLRGVAQRLLPAFPLGPRLVQLVETTASALSRGALRPLIRRYPRPTPGEYEQAVDEAIQEVRAVGSAVVLQGPAGFNREVASPAYDAATEQIYEQVNAMVKRLASGHGVVMVDRMDVVGRQQPALFLPGSGRYSPLGHQVMGRLLAERILAAGLV